MPKPLTVLTFRTYLRMHITLLYGSQVACRSRIFQPVAPRRFTSVPKGSPASVVKSKLPGEGLEYEKLVH